MNTYKLWIKQLREFSKASWKWCPKNIIKKKIVTKKYFLMKSHFPAKFSIFGIDKNYRDPKVEKFFKNFNELLLDGILRSHQTLLSAIMILSSHESRIYQKSLQYYLSIWMLDDRNVRREEIFLYPISVHIVEELLCRVN